MLFGALRYSKWHKGGRKTAAQLTMFDESEPCRATGGVLKTLFFIGERPYPITFNPPLDAIIAGAAEFFYPRYMPPSEKDKESYNKLKAMGLDNKLLNKGTAYGMFLVRSERVQARGTWVAFLRKKLKEDGWPSKDFCIQKLEFPVVNRRKPRRWLDSDGYLHG